MSLSLCSVLHAQASSLPFWVEGLSCFAAAAIDPSAAPCAHAPAPFDLAVHAGFELLAYLVGFTLLRFATRRTPDLVPPDQRRWLVVAAILGAAIGSKLLHHLNHPTLLIEHANNLAFLASGRTIVGGLVGGWVAVEWAKRRLGVTARTGDRFVFPLLASIAVGRLGCAWLGVHDDTAGVATTLPWGMNLGDDVLRHPTALYEIGFIGLLALTIRALERARPRPIGWRFQLFLASYLGFRVICDAWKPGERILFDLTAIQIVALVGAAFETRNLWLGRTRKVTAHA